MYEGMIPLEYKAVSASPYLQDDFIFMATDNPTEYLLGDETVPAIQGLMPIDEENPTPRVFKFQGMIKVTFWETFKALIEMYPEKLKEYEESVMAKRFKEQNPTADPSEQKSVPR